MTAPPTNPASMSPGDPGTPAATAPAVPKQGAGQLGTLGSAAVGRTMTVPRLVDWLQSELLTLTRPFAQDHEREMRCEEYVEGDRFVLRVELPGIDPERDVELTVSGGVLTVRAERRHVTREHAHRSEFFYGLLARTFVLPRGADENAVTATYRDGVLEVRVPLGSTPARSVPVSRGPR
ncbi:MAG: Hsp20/alpha crystallin family protein [Kineosporiaceae bacterium]